MEIAEYEKTLALHDFDGSLSDICDLIKYVGSLL